MTPDQITALRAYAAAEIARHEAGLAIRGGAGVTVSGEGLSQSIAVHVPGIIQEPIEDTWKLMLYLKAEWTSIDIDANGDATHRSGAHETWQLAAIFDRDRRVHSTYAWEDTQFGNFPPQGDSPASNQRQVTLSFALRAFEENIWAHQQTPPIAAGSYRIPLRLTLAHIIASSDSGPLSDQPVHKDKIIVRRGATHYTPRPIADGEMYQIRLIEATTV